LWPTKTADDVVRLQAQPVAERATHGRRLRDLHAVRVDGVGDDVDQRRRDVLEFPDVLLHHPADGDHPGLAFRCVLPSLDGAVGPELRVEHLAQDVKSADDGVREPHRIRPQAAAVDAPLGNDDVVLVGVDEADGAVVICLRERPGRRVRETGDLPAPARAARFDLDAAHLGGERPLRPARGVEVDLAAGLDQAPAKVDDVGLGPASRGIDAREVQGQPHESGLPVRMRAF
jgi:hypothetical protein